MKKKKKIHSENINIATNAFKEAIPNLNTPIANVFEREELPSVLGFFYQIIIRFTQNWGQDDKQKKPNFSNQNIFECKKKKKNLMFY